MMCNVGTGSACAGGHAVDKARLERARSAHVVRLLLRLAPWIPCVAQAMLCFEVTGSCALCHFITSAGSIAKDVKLRLLLLGPAAY